MCLEYLRLRHLEVSVPASTVKQHNRCWYKLRKGKLRQCRGSKRDARARVATNPLGHLAATLLPCSSDASAGKEKKEQARIVESHGKVSNLSQFRVPLALRNGTSLCMVQVPLACVNCYKTGRQRYRVQLRCRSSHRGDTA